MGRFWASSSSSSLRFLQENRQRPAEGLKLPAGSVEAGPKEERTGSHGCHSHRCVHPLPHLILLRILPLFSSGLKKKKIQNKEVLTHQTPQILPKASHPDGPQIWARTRPEMVVSMVTPERVAWEMTPFGLFES